jgi:hypothetical protein
MMGRVSELTEERAYRDDSKEEIPEFNIMNLPVRFTEESDFCAKWICYGPATGFLGKS